jgi:Ca2+:H+ antiporter
LSSAVPPTHGAVLVLPNLVMRGGSPSASTLDMSILGLSEPLLGKDKASVRGSASSLWLRIVAVVMGLSGPAAAFLGMPDLLVASFNVVALVVLAILLASAVEQLAHVAGPVVGSLIATTLSNVVALTLSLVALRRGMLRFVQVNLLGSVVSSCLLIPGVCFVARGLSNPRDKLNKHTGAMASLVLLLASLAYCVTTAFNVTTHSHRKHERECAVYCDDEPVLGISRLVALVLLCCYAVMLVWSTMTHAHLTSKKRSSSEAKAAASEELKRATSDNSLVTLVSCKSASPHRLEFGSRLSPISSPVAQGMPPLAPPLGLAPPPPPAAASPARPHSAGLVSLLTGTTLLTLWVAACAEALLGSLDGATRQLNLSHHFVTLVFVPNVGGVDSIITSCALSLKGNVDFALSFAIGSAIQILIGVLPLLVLVGWWVDQPLLLDLRVFEAILLFLCVLTVNGVLRRASATYLEGVMMLGTYLVVALTYAFRDHPREYGPSVADGGDICICGQACCAPHTTNFSLIDPATFAASYA